MKKYLGLFKNDVRCQKICIPSPPMSWRFPNSELWVTKKKHSGDTRLTSF